MAWSWSHTSEAYANAEANLNDLPLEELRVIAAEWGALIPSARDADYEGFSPASYAREMAGPDYREADEFAELIWRHAEDQATCDNGGFNAWVCPYGCHTVPFDREVS